MTFAASLFSMQITAITDNASIGKFIGLAFGLLSFVYGLRVIIRSSIVTKLGERISYETRAYTDYTGTQGLPTSKFLKWAWARCFRAIVALLLLLGSMATALSFLWLSQSSVAYKTIFTLYIVIAFGVIARVTFLDDRVRDFLVLWDTKRFLDQRDQQSWLSDAPRSVKLYISRNRLWRLLRGRGLVFGISLLVVIAPLAPLWSRDLDVGLKVGVTVAMFIVAYLVRMAFVGHNVGQRQDGASDRRFRSNP